MNSDQASRAGANVARRHCARLAIAVLAVSVAGCGGTALRQAFNDYSQIYAGVANRQLLLNLARAANSHPPHFLQLGLINTTFTFATSASATVSNTATTGRGPASPTATGPFHFLSNLFTASGTLTGVAAETPTFSLTPLSGPQFAQGFLAAVTPQVFFTLLEQGKPIDQLLRVLVHSIEFTHSTTGELVTLQNTPLADHYDSWVQFLRLAGILLELQRRELLSVSTTAMQTVTPGPVFEAPTLEEALKAAEKGLSLKEVSPGKYALSGVTVSSGLRLAPGSDKVFAELGKEPYFRLEALAPRTGTEAAPLKTGEAMTMTLRLRSFFTAMSWTASEQRVFDRLAAQAGFLDTLPPSQRQSILRLRWDTAKEDEVEAPLVTLEYGHQTYAVSDLRGQTWNREVFTLLSFVQSQVALDPKQLPVQQLINVR
jgi:hypothetical protein